MAERLCSGLSEVCDRYDTFLVDAWGTLHDGTTAYPGAVECMQQLAARRKRIVLLSNSSRKKDSTLAVLSKVGFDVSQLRGVVTSGDVAWHGLRAPAKEPYKCLVLGYGDDDLEYVVSAGLSLADAGDCDFILARGSFALYGASVAVPQQKETIFERPEVVAAIEQARSRGVPMLVTNPDFLCPGTTLAMPGAMGRRYAAAGGTVHTVGKPYDTVYERCREVAGGGDGSGGGRVCAIGDSLHHDIRGALSAGIACIFILNGLHAPELGTAGDDCPPTARIDAIVAEHLPAGAQPTHVMTRLKW